MQNIELEKFWDEIQLMPEAVAELNKLIENEEISEEEYVENSMLFAKDREQFYERVMQKQNHRIHFLYYFSRMALQTWEQYVKKGISRRIYVDTFYDLTLWCGNCFRDFGEYGINEYGWFFRHLNLSLLRLGRLQYEIMESPWEIQAPSRKIQKGDLVISVHIPQGEKLDPNAVQSSLKQAYEFLGTDMPYLCHSWLLYPGLKEILNEDSNILKFQQEFHLLAVDYAEREGEQRIFTALKEKPQEYPENTTLQRNAKQYLLSGKRLGSGLGIIR